MKHTHSFQYDEHFGGRVVLVYEIKAKNYIMCSVHVPDAEVPYVWSVEICKTIDHTPEAILNELKKPEYMYEGCSQAY